MTAEFAIVLPAVITVFSLLVGTLALQLRLVGLADAAALAVRQEAWGSGYSPPPQGVRFEVNRLAESTCVTAVLEAVPGWLSALVLEEKACLPNRGF